MSKYVLYIYIHLYIQCDLDEEVCKNKDEIHSVNSYRNTVSHELRPQTIHAIIRSCVPAFSLALNLAILWSAGQHFPAAFAFAAVTSQTWQPPAERCCCRQDSLAGGSAVALAAPGL